MLRRATKMILGGNRIRILQRTQIYTLKFQNTAHWLSKSEKHVHAQSRHQKCPFWSGFWPGESIWLVPFDSSRNSTQKTFFMIFPKILIWHELPWISVNCHEMRGSQENFVDTIGFFIKFCATYVLDRSVEQIWAPLYGFGGLFFFYKKKQDLLPCRPQPLKETYGRNMNRWIVDQRRS